MAIPKAPGQNLLKATGIFYTVAGGVSIISALLVSPIVSLFYISNTAQRVLPAWGLTALNTVLAMLERLHIIVPELSSISSRISRVPEIPLYIHYAGKLVLPISFTVSSIILSFVAVIIGIFVAFTGIIAVKYCDTLNRTKVLIIFALINLGMMITSTIFLVSFFSVVGCVIAVLYFVGVLQNYISHEKIYAETGRDSLYKKIIKYAGITAAPILCMTILFTTLFQPIAVQITNDSKFYLNGENDGAYIHIIDENHLQLIDFNMDSVTKVFEERLGFQGDDLKFIQAAYSGEIEFEVKENRIYAIIPKYRGYNIDFSIAYKNENTILFQEEQYIKQ
jgi:hypothetical protein